MVGEMRDLETTEIAIRGALTGHLVFSTLHTNDAVAGISRLLDMGIEPFLIATSVRAFIAQRLVRTLCEQCKKPVEVDESYLQQVDFPLEWKDEIFQPVGCRACRDTGFKGRMSIVEICLLTNELQELITQNRPVSELKAQALKDGMIQLRRYGWRKVAEGKTTLDEVLTNTTEVA